MLYEKVCKYLNDNGKMIDRNKFEIVQQSGETFIGFWDYDITEPTEKELSAYTQEEIDLVFYAENRRKEYPSLVDQLDAIWKGGEAFDEMKAKVMAVKTKYPKK